MGFPAQRLDLSVPAARRLTILRAADSSARPTAARPGRRSPRKQTRVFRRSPTAGSRSRSRPRIRSGFMPSSNQPTARSLFPTTAAQTWEQARQEQVDGLASVLFREPDRRSEKSGSRFQDRRRAHPERRRRARASPPSADSMARMATSTPSGSIRPIRKTVISGRRRRNLVCLRRRQPLVEGEQPADLAVLSRERGRRRSRIRFTADCRITVAGSASRNIPAESPMRSGKTSSMATVSTLSSIRLIPITFTPNIRAATSAGSIATRSKRASFSRSRTTRKSCASTGTRRWSLRLTRKERSISARNFFSAPATTARAGNASRPT